MTTASAQRSNIASVLEWARHGGKFPTGLAQNGQAGASAPEVVSLTQEAQGAQDRHSGPAVGAVAKVPTGNDQPRKHGPRMTAKGKG